ncbi:DUF6254 family protein [Paenibacillus spongiae]|uniref:DUF6254 family protein n=1 Tax=Paenibacillus spongiae TaxID=2909671 RepID=A0ABY5S3T9_9BACL|nr:DUF6254 family protein [Paenibacillus spongiae]UVI28576.1 DUF6254 family protein [Paenibacillus spongiae]
MTSSQGRRQSAWKSRKQNRKPHDKIKSFAEIYNESTSNGAGFRNHE